MKKVTQVITEAFMSGKSKTMSNTSTDGKALYLFGNKIAEHREDGTYISNAGWKSKTTKERLTGLPNVNIYQKKYKWYLNGNEWDGDWTRISTSPPPAIDDKSDTFVMANKWVNTGGYRGYEQPTYAVVGASDTGMWSDSPCRSDVSEKEINDIINELKKHGIKSKAVMTNSSNVFMMKRFVIVTPKNHAKALGIVSDYLNNNDTRLAYIVD